MRSKNSRTCRTCQDPFEDPGAGKRSAPAGFCSRKCADAATRERANRKASMRAVPPRVPRRLFLATEPPPTMADDYIKRPGTADTARGSAPEVSPMQEAGYTHAPIRVCTECGTEYQDRGKGSGIRRNLCSQACATTVRERLIGGGRGKRARVCETCGITFLGKPAARFCSRECCHEEQKVTNLRGETIPCAHCGKDFYRKRSAPNQRFCSHECRGAVMPPPSSYPNARAKISAAKMGDGNPMFRNGLSPDTVRRRHFNLALKGENRCRNCGAMGELHMHHVIPRSMYREGITEILNGIPLCPSCHSRWHHRSITICRDVFTAEEWAYLTSVKLVGQDVLAWLDDRYPGSRDDHAA